MAAAFFKKLKKHLCNKSPWKQGTIRSAPCRQLQHSPETPRTVNMDYIVELEDINRRLQQIISQLHATAASKSKLRKTRKPRKKVKPMMTEEEEQEEIAKLLRDGFHEITREEFMATPIFGNDLCQVACRFGRYFKKNL